MIIQCPICLQWKEEVEFEKDEEGYLQRDCSACRDAWYYQTKRRMDETLAEKLGVGFF